MTRKSLLIPMDGSGGYVNKHIWEQEKNKSTYYDRKLDMQGSVPGISMEETIKAFEDKYQIKL